ncbi:hypothetical protein Pfo_000589 [Paulownia fortunei]|nr:hypothetical protein Pfo_000589 [Paulownia fortunei]
MPFMDNPWGSSHPKPERLGGPSPKLSTRVSEKFERTKEVASAGMEKTKEVASAGVEKTKVGVKKVKEGASTGVNWLKLKKKEYEERIPKLEVLAWNNQGEKPPLNAICVVHQTRWSNLEDSKSSNFTICLNYGGRQVCQRAVGTGFACACAQLAGHCFSLMPTAQAICLSARNCFLATGDSSKAAFTAPPSQQMDGKLPSTGPSPGRLYRRDSPTHHADIPPLKAARRRDHRGSNDW